MTGKSYRIPAYPVAPGAQVPDQDFVIATKWRIKSMITAPMEGSTVKAGQPVRIAGHAWAGEDEVEKVELSFDHGRHWVRARLGAKAAKYAWHGWDYSWKPTERGYFEIWVRAWDQNGDTQPPLQPWNPKGYLGNVIHRVPVNVEA